MSLKKITTQRRIRLQQRFEREGKRCLTKMRKKYGHGILFYRSKPTKPRPLDGSELLVNASYCKNTISVIIQCIFPYGPFATYLQV